MNEKQLYIRSLYIDILGIISEEINVSPEKYYPSFLEDIHSTSNLFQSCLENPLRKDNEIGELEKIHRSHVKYLLHMKVLKGLRENEVKGVTLNISHKKKSIFDITFSKGSVTYHMEQILTGQESISSTSRLILNKIEAIEKILEEGL